MLENKEIKKAMNELQEMSEDEELRRLAELKEKAIRDEENGLRHAREEGIKEGIKQDKKEIAKKMKEEGFPIETIIKIIGIAKEEIDTIQ